MEDGPPTLYPVDEAPTQSVLPSSLKPMDAPSAPMFAPAPSDGEAHNHGQDPDLKRDGDSLPPPVPSQRPVPRPARAPPAEHAAKPQPGFGPQRRRMSPRERRRVILGSIFVGIALCAVVLGALVIRGILNERNVELMVLVSPPERARVLVNGKSIRNNEVSRLPPGEYVVEGSADGYRTQRRDIHLVRGQITPPVTMMLDRNGPPPAPAPPGGILSDEDAAHSAPSGAAAPPDDKAAVPRSLQASGSVSSAGEHPGDPPTPSKRYLARFASEVNGVEVQVDGKSAGKTPNAERGNLLVGRMYTVTARRPGYRPYSGTFSTLSSADLEVPLRLEKQAPAAQRPVADDEARAPTHVLATPVGNGSASARSGSKGKLACSTNPAGAEIWVDSHPTGRQTPAALQNPLLLSLGTHTVVFKIGGKKSEPQRVTISEKEVAKLVNVPVE